MKRFFKKLFARTIWGRLRKLEEQVKELSKKTISQKTTQEDAPVPYSQILDEWQNGAEEE